MTTPTTAAGRAKVTFGHTCPADAQLLALRENTVAGPVDDVALIAAMRNALPLYLALEDAARAWAFGSDGDHLEDERLLAALDALDAWKRGEK